MKILHAYDLEAYSEDRYKAMLSARKILATKPKYLDTETTGLHDAFLVEICILSHHGSPLINTLIQPPFPIPDDVIRIHGITNDMVADAPKFPDVYTRLKEILETGVTCIYNADFDCTILNNCCDYYQLPRIEFSSRSVMKLYAKYYGEYSSYWGNYKWQKLPGGGKHRAYEDTKACYNLLRKMATIESCAWQTPPRQFPEKQIFCDWEEWLRIAIHKKNNYGYEKTKVFSIRKPVFKIKNLKDKFFFELEFSENDVPW